MCKYIGLINDEHSQLEVKCLKGVALEFYLKETNIQMPYQIVVDKLPARYNRPQTNLSLQSEVYSLNVDDFIVRYRI